MFQTSFMSSKSSVPLQTDISKYYKFYKPLTYSETRDSHSNDSDNNVGYYGGRILLRSDTETQKITTDANPQFNIMPSAKQYHLTTTGTLYSFWSSGDFFFFEPSNSLSTFSFGNIEL